MGRLKVIQNSEVFPTACIAYRKGALDEAVLKKFKDGMVSANKNDRGRSLMGQWQITGFEAVPDDYDRTIADILKAYPAPVEVKSAQK